jgi:hypothetical protein
VACKLYWTKRFGRQKDQWLKVSANTTVHPIVMREGRMGFDNKLKIFLEEQGGLRLSIENKESEMLG